MSLRVSIRLQQPPPGANLSPYLSSALTAVVTAYLTCQVRGPSLPTLCSDQGCGQTKAPPLPQYYRADTTARAPRLWSLTSSCQPRHHAFAAFNLAVAGQRWSCNLNRNSQSRVLVLPNVIPWDHKSACLLSEARLDCCTQSDPSLQNNMMHSHRPFLHFQIVFTGFASGEAPQNIYNWHNSFLQFVVPLLFHYCW